MNQLKTILLLGALSALLVAAGAAIGPQWAWGALALALGMNLFAWFFSDRLVLRMSGARETSPGEAPELHAMVAELSARAGYDPAAAVRLWEKMMAANKGAPPQWLSTHPASGTRIRDIQASLPQVAGLYSRAARPDKRFPVAQPLKPAPQVSG